MYKSRNLKYLLSLVPGKRRLGIYRFLPVFFCIGGVMEWIMINVRIGKETFSHSGFPAYETKARDSRDDVYRRKRSEREYQQKITDGLMVPVESGAK